MSDRMEKAYRTAMLNLAQRFPGRKLDRREAAEAVEWFGDTLATLDGHFTALVERMPAEITDRVNAIDGQDRLGELAEAFRALGDKLCEETDAEP